MSLSILLYNEAKDAPDGALLWGNPCCTCPITPKAIKQRPKIEDAANI
jgi:hypothetical protein